MKANHIPRTKRSPRRAVLLALLLSLLVVVPVLAAYIGPDRTETTYVNRRRHCHYVASTTYLGTNYYCTLDLYYTPGASCPSNVAAYFDGGTCGWPVSCTDPGVSCSITPSSSIESCTAGQTGCRSVEQTVTHPPATISGSINCPATGDNGYCTAAASLSLSGNEPLSGYSIITLEGTYNGALFSCDGDSCTINLVEGANTFTFWALSDWGDSSLMGNASRGVDTNPPSINGSTSGTTGSGGWYVSQVTVTASASDPSPGSGLASFQASVDGGGYSAYSGPITLGDGSHTVELLARDNAGWTDSASMSFQIDTVAPTTVISSPTGSTWATGTIPISGVTSDLNLNGAEISFNGGSSWSGLSPDGAGNWFTNWDTHTVSNGSYSVRARGRDQAGNVGAADSVTIMVDNGVPRIYIPDSWPIWQRVAINVVDNGIGVDRVRLTIHAGSYGERVYNWNSGQDDFLWDRYIDGVAMPIGGYPVEVEAWDRVGNKGSAWGEIVIPAPDDVEEEDDSGVLSIEPSEEPSDPPVTSGGSEPVSEPTNTPQPPSVVVFGSESSAPEETGSGEIALPSGSSNLLAGAAATAAIGVAMAVVAIARRRREEEEKQKAAAAAKFNKHQIALEEYRAWKAAQRKWEAEQAAAIAEAEAPEDGDQGDGSGITTGEPAPTYFTYVEAEKQRQREEELRRKQEEREQHLAATACPVDFGETSNSTSSIDLLATIPGYRPEPVLEPVPSFFSDPVGWYQATMINRGRQDEEVRARMVNGLAPIADSLKSMANPERNPFVTEERKKILNFLNRGVEGWERGFEGAGVLWDYTTAAIKDGRWDDVDRAGDAWMQAVNESKYETEMATGKGVLAVGWGIITSPYRLVTRSIPNFVRAVRERQMGEDRFWDVIYSGTMVAGDASATYCIGQWTGINARINTFAENLLVRPQQTALAEYYGTELSPDARPNFQGWEATKVSYPEGTELVRLHTAVKEGGWPAGGWWLENTPTSVTQWRIDSAVLPAWNTAGEMSTLVVPAGETLTGWVGIAGYQTGVFVGGGTQVYLPVVPEGWITTIPSTIP